MPPASSSTAIRTSVARLGLPRGAAPVFSRIQAADEVQPRIDRDAHHAGRLRALEQGQRLADVASVAHICVRATSGFGQAVRVALAAISAQRGAGGGCSGLNEEH